MGGGWGRGATVKGFNQVGVGKWGGGGGGGGK